MSRSENTPVDDPPEAEWIDRCALMMGEALTSLPHEHVVELAAEAWRDARGHHSPERAGLLAVRGLEEDSGLPAILIGRARPPNTPDKAAWIQRFKTWMLALGDELPPEVIADISNEVWEQYGRTHSPEDAAILEAGSWGQSGASPS